MKPKAIIFDVDGTIADTERDGHRPAFNLAFQDAGLDWHWDEGLYGRLLEVTGGKERIGYFIERYLDGPKPNEPESLARKLHKLKTEHYLRLTSEGRIPLRPGIERLIRQARAEGITLAIATTTTPENVTSLLRATMGEQGLTAFSYIGAGDIVPAKKPAPDIYIHVLEKLGLSAGQCIALEDSWNGLQSAHAAGIPTLVTVNDYTKDQEFRGSLAVLSDLGEEHAPFHIVHGHHPVLKQGFVDVSVLQALLPN